MYKRTRGCMTIVLSPQPTGIGKPPVDAQKYYEELVTLLHPARSSLERLNHSQLCDQHGIYPDCSEHLHSSSTHIALAEFFKER
jgi:hypothetical protein